MNEDLEAIDGSCAKIIEQRDHIEVLEAALKEAGVMWVRKDNRIEVLETALRKIVDSPFTGETAWRQGAKIARAALDPSSPPKAST